MAAWAPLACWWRPAWLRTAAVCWVTAVWTREVAGSGRAAGSGLPALVGGETEVCVVALACCRHNGFAGGERVSGLRRMGVMSEMLRVKTHPVAAGRRWRRLRASFPSLEAPPWKSPTSSSLGSSSSGESLRPGIGSGDGVVLVASPPLGRRLEEL